MGHNFEVIVQKDSEVNKKLYFCFYETGRPHNRTGGYRVWTP